MKAVLQCLGLSKEAGSAGERTGFPPDVDAAQLGSANSRKDEHWAWYRHWQEKRNNPTAVKK